jgi:nitrite reductase/ring-hydroxylating ferredoxin subunit
MGLQMEFFKQVLGICNTKKPEDVKGWAYREGKIELDWARIPELQKPCGAVRLEGRGLPKRILLIYGMDGQYHAFRNRCVHLGRRLDPVSGKAVLRCCSLFGTTYDYAGNVMSGPGKTSLKKYKVEKNKCKLFVHIG